MPKNQHDVIPGFSPVAPTIWECHFPNTCEKPSTGSSPDLIILFSWTGANGRHVLKYTSQYQTLFPTSRILVITTSIKDLCFRSSPTKQSRLQPAVERILSYGDIGDILIHVFSEGGSNKAAEFAEAYQRTTGARLPCSALCLDSTPGHPRFLRLCNALKKSLPPARILRASGLIIGGTILGGFWIVYGIFKGAEKNVISKTRKRLMDDTYWDLEAPRCYLYSKADELIAWQDVQEHATEARYRGVPVVEACFVGSAHCKHAADDPTRYWGAVVDTWNMSDFAWPELDSDAKEMNVLSASCSQETLC